MKQKLDLANFGLIEIEAHEAEEINGGSLPGLFKFVAETVVDAAVSFGQGVQAGWNAVREASK